MGVDDGAEGQVGALSDTFLQILDTVETQIILLSHPKLSCCEN